MRKKSHIGSVVVVGGGIAGVQTSLDLADMGLKVFLIERLPSIGGVMALLDKTFPTNDCSMCILSPKLVDCSRHPNIEIITSAEMQKIEGEPGDFSVEVLVRPRYVDIDKCTACGECSEVCPIDMPNEFEYGLSERKAVFKPFPQAIPNAFAIDKIGDGIHRACIDCMKCVRACKTGAINHEMKEELRTLKAGAVVLAMGSSAFDPSVRRELGFGRCKNVLSSLQFERMLSASGPTEGKILRRSDGTHPKRVAWVQCVGSRDPTSGNEQCSSMCCMYTAKQAVIAKEHDSSIEPTVFYIDLRTFGKDFDRYINNAKEKHKVSYVRSRVSEIEELENECLRIVYEDECGTLHHDVFDMVVLSVGLCMVQDSRSDLMNRLGLSENEFGFVSTENLDPVVVRPGVFAVGSFVEPMAIPESVMMASAAAAKVGELLSDARGTLVSKKEYPPERDVWNEKPRVGVFVCHCGINIGGVVDVKDVVRSIRRVPGVVFASDNMYTCSEDTQKVLARIIKKYDLNRVVVAACTPRTHEPLFQKSLREAGLNPHLLEMTNIREQCSWVHTNDPVAATNKAKKLLEMTVEKAKLLSPISQSSIPVKKKALVVGGGISGLSVALSIAKQGFPVALVEKDKQLGGFLRRISSTVEGYDVAELLKNRIAEAKKNKLIEIYTDTVVSEVSGYVGSYASTLKTKKGEVTVNHGVTVVCIGSDEYEPSSYGYGKYPCVVTQTQLEEYLTDCREDSISTGESFVMIQCVESRVKQRPYCSRICCLHALKNALHIKELNPLAEVYILYRDMMTYGFLEKYYKLARENGVVFLQYDLEKTPVVEEQKQGLVVKVFDRLLDEEVVLAADHVVLSTGLAAPLDGSSVSKQWKVPLNDDGFFLEAHVKLRPVDCSTRGVFLAGSCHLPKFIGECVFQAEAASARAATILSQKTLEAEANIAVVDPLLCCACEACVRVCPYNAVEIVEEQINGKMIAHAKVNEGLCQACGSCVGGCPNGAVQQKGFSDKQILSMIRVLSEV